MSNPIKSKMLDVLENHKIGTLATLRGDKPFTRFMLFFNEELTLFTATHSETHKVEDISKNRYVHILLGNGRTGWDQPYVEIEGTISVEDSKERKEKFWNDKLKNWIPSADDPNYLLLKITPISYRYFESSSSEAEVLTI